MYVIPVLDIKDRVVVLASGGKRDDYRPIDSPIAPRPQAEYVVASFLSLFSFSRFYIADLDAIAGSAKNTMLVKSLASSYPQIEFYLDAGINSRAKLRPFTDNDNIRPVIGSESQTSMEQYLSLLAAISSSDPILSLDRKNEQELGPIEIFEQARHWPRQIIAMDLNSVGSDAGPNYQWLVELQQQRGDIEIIASGGVRNVHDLFKLREMGIEAALVATALHRESITANDLQALSCEPGSSR